MRRADAGAGIDVEGTFLEHHAELFRFLARECGDATAAKDAVQETFLRLHRSPPEDLGAVRTWLYTTGLNVLRDQVRVRRNRERLLEENRNRLPLPTPEPSPLSVLEREADRVRLRDALDSLRPRERTALLMRESGFKHREIAEAIGVTTGTVGTLLARALGKLARALGSEVES